MLRFAFLFAVFALHPASALPAAAQQREAALTLVPAAGWYMPQRDLASTSRLPVDMASGPVVGLRAETHLPVRGTGVRGGFAWVGSELTRPRLAGGTECGEVCTIIPGEYERIGGAQLYLAFADLFVRGPHLGPVQPYAVVGGGLKRYDFAQEDLSGDFASAFAEDETVPMRHGALGLSVSLGAHTAVMEAGSYSTRSSEHGRQDDLALTVGVRLRALR